MARLNTVTVPESDYSFGIDARSSENQIAPGFVRDLLNADIIEKRPRKRVGYQGYSGNVPIRVTSMEYVDGTDSLRLTLDSAISLADLSVDLSATRSTPLVIHGRSSNVDSGAPFTTAGDNTVYYSGFTVPTRKTLVATSSAPPYETVSVPSGEHGFTTTSIFTQMVQATSFSDKSHSAIFPATAQIDASTYDIDIEYQNSTSGSLPVYIFYREAAAAIGENYVATLNHTGSGLETFSIPAATHGLVNFNIITQLQADRTTYVENVLSDVSISNTGEVTFSIDCDTATTFYGILSTTPVDNSIIGNVSPGATNTITIPDIESPWVFVQVYREMTPGGSRELVIPQSVEYDESTSTVDVTLTNLSGSSANFYIYYDYGVLRSNRIEVTDPDITVSAVDSRPQLTVWGLDHSEIYGPSAEGRSGWVTHIDSYRSEGEKRLIAGLGGNLFSARTYDEAAVEYLYPLLFPRLQARTSADTNLAPVFHTTGDTPSRSRGYILGDGIDSHRARVSSIVYDEVSGHTDVTVTIPGMSILDSDGNPTTVDNVLSTTSNIEDWLTLTNMSYSRHNGTFRVVNVSESPESLVFRCVIPNNDSDYDDTSLGGWAGVYTDQLEWLTTSPFVPGDILVNASLGDNSGHIVMGSAGSVTILSGISDTLGVSGGLVTIGRRTSHSIPLRTALPEGAVSVENVVRGDMLSYSGPDHLTGADQVERHLRVLAVNPDSDRLVDIEVDAQSGAAIVTYQSGDTRYLIEGGYVLLLQAGEFSGERLIMEVLSETEFVVDLPAGATENVTGATLLGGTVQVDEELQWEDSTGDTIYLWTESRWIPVEAPDDSYDLTPSTYVRHLDSRSYGNQDFLRSTTVMNNMYLENYADEAMKFDGTNIYRAGLPTWQPGLFLVQDTTAAARIVAGNRTIAYTAIDAALGSIEVGMGSLYALPLGTSVRLTGSTQTYTIREYREYDNSGTPVYQILLDRALDSDVDATGSISEIATYRYYYRLSAIDANDNIVASATTGYQDHVVELTSDAAIHHKLVGLPAWDIYDYQRIELEIYRTRKNTPAPFYRVTTIPVEFDNTLGYIQYTDSYSDQDLIDLDPVNTALKGTELGINWQNPLRAKYVTSLGNRLVVANIRDYPQLDMQIIASGAVTSATYAGKRFLLRASNTDTGTATNMTERVAYEFVGSASGTISNHTTNGDTFSFDTSSALASSSPGDWIYLTYAVGATSGIDLTYSGWWQIAGISGSTVTVNLVDAPTVTDLPDTYVVATDTSDVPVFLGTDGNLGMVNGDSFDLFDATRRLSMAINASMRMTDVSISGMEAFVPWIISRSGNDVGRSGRILIRQSRVTGNTPELVLPDSFSGSGESFRVFVNDVRRDPDAEVSAITRLYPSRLLASYENYPEIMDNPTSVLDTESDSAIDINSADGQEITGIIPFFGEAAFGSAQKSAVLVVFKTNSIYLVDLNEKAAGRNPVQKIESKGLGCTAPYSITSTNKGIMFANESGIYCLRRDQTIQYVGKYMERNWTEGVNLDNLSIVQGHNYSLGRMYKLSVPGVGEERNSRVFVYNHTGEEDGRIGAWARYDNHNATGWANLDTEVYWSSSSGRVFSLRNTGTSTDYRDDDQAVHFRLDTRAIDAGDSGIRKLLSGVIVQYRVLASDGGTTLSYSTDMATEFTETTEFELSRSLTGKDIVSVNHNISRQRGTYFAFRIDNDTLDEALEVAGMDLRIAGLSGNGITDAADTRTRR